MTKAKDEKVDSEELQTGNEESLEDIVDIETSEEEGLEEIMDDGLELVSDVDTVGIAVQLANSLQEGATRMLESNDIEQDGLESLEETLSREWRPENDNKQSGNFYSGKKDDDSIYTVAGSSSTSGLYNQSGGDMYNAAGSSSSSGMYNQSGGDMYNSEGGQGADVYQSGGKTGDMYQGGTQVGFGDPNNDIGGARLDEVRGLDSPSLDIGGVTKRKDSQESLGRK